MVTADHMNILLKSVLKLIKNNIGNENAPWMTRIAGKYLMFTILSLYTILTLSHHGPFLAKPYFSCNFVFCIQIWACIP